MIKDDRRTPSLNHVCMLTNHGWVRVTAEEAVKMGATGVVSSHGGQFMCELCGQYVTLAKGEKYVPYFKHSAYEKSKNCPERTMGAEYVPDYLPNQYELPIRLCNISDNGFKLQIGMLYIPEKLLKAAKTKCIIITPFGSKKPYNYQFSRLNLDSITYLDIGCDPAEKYLLDCDPTLQSFWPAEVRGIMPEGSVFDARTGKLLPLDADVELGKEYYLLGTKNYFYRSRDLEVTKLCHHIVSNRVWYLYKIKALVLSETTAIFFLNLHCRLTDMPIRLQPIWPLYRKLPYTLQHEKNFIFFHMQGTRKTSLKTFPMSVVRYFDCPHEEGKVTRVTCADRQQVISMGQSNVQQYTYFWKAPMDEETPLPEVHVCDLKELPIEQGIISEIPYKNTLVVRAPYSGELQIRRKGILIDRRMLKAETRTEINNLNFGDQISILQGLDLVYEVSFILAPKELEGTNETEILQSLQSCGGKQIPVSHHLGSVAEKLAQYPYIRQWLFGCIRRGSISENALRHLKKFLIDIQ